MQSTERAVVLDRWMRRSSDAEDDRMDRAHRMVKSAIDSHPAFDGYRDNIEIYVKGSYANLTNVRADSDVDVVVENHDVFYYDYFPEDITPAPHLRPQPYTGRWDDPDDWREEVAAALRAGFGPGDVDTDGDVALTVCEVPGSRPSADVVPSFLYHRYDSADRGYPRVGSRVFKRSYGYIDNFPNLQLANGRTKDAESRGRYKKYVRALKNAENHLASEGIIDELPSYFMECLVWNVPNGVLTTGYTLDDGFRAALAFLMGNLHDDQYVDTAWDEPNRLKYLFRGQSKWSPEDGLFLAFRTWQYLGYSQ